MQIFKYDMYMHIFKYDIYVYNMCVYICTMCVYMRRIERFTKLLGCAIHVICVCTYIQLGANTGTIFTPRIYIRCMYIYTPTKLIGCAIHVNCVYTYIQLGANTGIIFTPCTYIRRVYT